MMASRIFRVLIAEDAEADITVQRNNCIGIINK
jgi:hypothetical protein